MIKYKDIILNLRNNIDKDKVPEIHHVSFDELDKVT